MLAPGIDIEIGGRTRVMRPTIRAMMAIEKELGEPSMTLIQRIMSMNLGATDTLTIIYHGLNGTTDRMEKHEIEAEMEAKGLNNFIRYVTGFLQAHLAGQPTGKPDADPNQAKTPGE